MRKVLTGIAAAMTLSLGMSYTAPVHAETKTLRMVPHADLKVLDPTFTTAYVTRNFGYMVYDTLFGFDIDGTIKSNMVSNYEVSDDGRHWVFTLRDDMQFSDGEPVLANDVVASLKRWTARDNIGAALTEAGGEWKKVDDLTFELTLTQPFGLVLDGLAKVSSYPAFILPEKLASAPTNRPLNDVLGSGPYLFKRDEWIPGNKVVFEKNPYYKGRGEKAKGLAGDKTSSFERVEWVVLPDSNSAMAAIQNNEVDLIESVPADYINPMRNNEQVNLGILEQAQAYLVMNQAFPPFNNVKARLALAHMIDQNQFTRAMGYPDDMRVPYCETFFICGSANHTAAGADPFRKPNPEKAKALLAESGYNGEKVVVLLPTDSAYLNAATLVAIQAMQDLGMNVDIQSMDWATLTARRSRKASVKDGGWTVFLSSASQFNVNSPISNTYLGAACGTSLPGWPCDEELDHRRAAWIAATTPEERQAALDAVQERAYESFTYLPLGEFSRNFASRKEVKNQDMLRGIPNVWVLDK